MTNLTNGFQKNIWDNCFKGNFTQLNNQMSKSIRDSKIKATYFFNYRFKNNSKKISNSNTESFELMIDTNLSEDFYYEDNNFIKGTSTIIALEKVKQKDFGKTILEISVKYIDENQRIFENQTFYYCETIKGRISQKLKEYKKAFDLAVIEELEKIKKNGFIINNRHHINNFAGYLYYENKRRDLKNKFLSSICPKVDINKILIIYSILNNDEFFKEIQYHNCNLNSILYNSNGEYNELYNSLLNIEEIERLEESIKIKEEISCRLFEGCIDKNTGYFDYNKFKEKIKI